MRMLEKQRGRVSFVTLTIGIVIALVVIGFGIQFGMHKYQERENMKNMTATVFPIPREIGQFNLVNNEGKPFTNESLKGHWTLMFFGFTNCPHICPTTMADLNQAYQLMIKHQVMPPQVVLVSIDPARDTVARMNTYVKGYNKAFIGVTGKEQEIEKLSKSLHVLYMKVSDTNSADASNYNIDHSGAIVLIDPQGKLSAIFSMPHKPEVLAKDFSIIKDHYA